MPPTDIKDASDGERKKERTARVENSQFLPVLESIFLHLNLSFPGVLPLHLSFFMCD
jgi:hypothetical protein